MSDNCYRDLLKEKYFFVVDTETTGLDPNDADVIEIAALKVVRKGAYFEVEDAFDEFINPHYPLSQQIIEFNERNNTGIDDEFLSKAPDVDVLAKKFLDFLGNDPVIVGHNIIRFDAAFINKMTLNGCGRYFEPKYYVDTLLLAREHEEGKHNLGACFERTAKRHSGEEPKYHTAIGDVLCTLDVLEHLTREYVMNPMEKMGLV